MKPGSDEYKTATKWLLTASDFGAACGLNPYKSRQRLWRLKTGREVFEGNDRTQYGNDNEHRAIAQYEVITGSLVTPGAFSVNKRYPTLGCTPDGLVGLTGLVEAKCPTSGLYKEIPAYYLAQAIGQMAIMKREWCDFIAWEPQESKIWRVLWSDKAWWWMQPKLEEMVSYIKSDIQPPKYGKNNPKPDANEFRSLIDCQLLE